MSSWLRMLVKAAHSPLARAIPTTMAKRQRATTCAPARCAPTQSRPTGVRCTGATAAVESLNAVLVDDQRGMAAVEALDFIDGRRGRTAVEAVDTVLIDDKRGMTCEAPVQ
mmetsp:Transcript_24759/g.83213  ORF Transcript_24759/g.83213 Transcript_24759/m.83213 type:complete len:111 (-) Transcript_24759:28-360(-)